MDRWPSKLPINGQSCRRVEVLAGPERRRWSWEEKVRILAESLALDAVASSLALRCWLHRNHLYAWRRGLRAAAEAAAADHDERPLVRTGGVRRGGVVLRSRGPC